MRLREIRESKNCIYLPPSLSSTKGSNLLGTFGMLLWGRDSRGMTWTTQIWRFLLGQGMTLEMREYKSNEIKILCFLLESNKY